MRRHRGARVNKENHMSTDMTPNNQMYEAVGALIQMGLRLDEILRLRWANFTMTPDGITIEVPPLKVVQAAGRTVAGSQQDASVMRAYRDACASKGGDMAPDALLFPQPRHSLRSGFISHQLRHAAGPAEVQHLTSRRDSATLKRYLDSLAGGGDRP